MSNHDESYVVDILEAAKLIQQFIKVWAKSHEKTIEPMRVRMEMLS